MPFLELVFVRLVARFLGGHAAPAPSGLSGLYPTSGASIEGLG